MYQFYWIKHFETKKTCNGWHDSTSSWCHLETLPINGRGRRSHLFIKVILWRGFSWMQFVSPRDSLQSSLRWLLVFSVCYSEHLFFASSRGTCSQETQNESFLGCFRNLLVKKKYLMSRIFCYFFYFDITLKQMVSFLHTFFFSLICLNFLIS